MLNGAAMKISLDDRFPLCANIVEGGRAEKPPAQQLTDVGFCPVSYPFKFVAGKVKEVRDALEELKSSFTIGAPGIILPHF